jgi:hypothetical protein
LGESPTNDQHRRSRDRKLVNRSPSPGPFFRKFTILAPLLLLAAAGWAGQAELPNPAAPLPEAPLPRVKHEKSKAEPCRVVPKSESAGAAAASTAAAAITISTGLTPPQSAEATTPPEAQTQLPPCPPPPVINFFARFLNGPEVKPLTPREKARLAVRNLLDPFEAITIGANAAIAIGSNSHTGYGPGMPGFAKYVGTSYAQEMTGEFFGTFLIPSIVHQDPHYHRMPRASIPRRVAHAIAQVVWTQGDDGYGMLNYANLVGFAIDDGIANLYVPGRETNVTASASRYAIGLGIAPTDNFITEFLPDLARRIHVRIVLVQRIINQVAKTE